MLRRISGPALERFIEERLKAATHGAATIESVERIDLQRGGITLTLPPSLSIDPAELEAHAMRLVPCEGSAVRIAINVELPLRGGRRTVNAGARTNTPDTTLVAALRRAHAMVAKDSDGGPVLHAAPPSPYDRRILNLAFLAPDIQRAIIEGTLPQRINLEQFVHADFPLDWDAQRARFC